MRLTKLLPLFCFAAVSVVGSQAQTIGNTGGAPGTYTYTFNLGNDASFVIAFNGAFGTDGSTLISYNFVGTPAVGYANDPSISWTGNNTYQYVDGAQVYDGGFDNEIVLQYDSVDENGNLDYSNTLDYTFTEPTSFWENLGAAQPFTTGDGEYIYGLQGWTGPDDGDTQFWGEVGEGAYDTYYGASDPPCTGCTVTTAFVPAAAATPEPSGLALLGTGVLGGVAAFRRRFV